MEALLLITEVLTYILTGVGFAVIVVCLFFAFKPKSKTETGTWYWEERTDFNGNRYMFPKKRENESCKCNHFKSHSNDISAGN